MKANELRINNLVYYNGNKNEIGVITGMQSTATKQCYIYLNNRVNNTLDLDLIKKIPLTEEWLLKFGFENWGKGKQWSNHYETYDRFVLHNDLDGTSNFEVHNVVSTYGDSYFQQFIISCDEDERINWGSEIKYVHQLQNLYFALTNKELITNN